MMILQPIFCSLQNIDESVHVCLVQELYSTRALVRLRRGSGIPFCHI